ncbi:putative sporulation protein YtaF [Caldanaerovirga acetigignens]|uniref:Putative sporulation protein YtaF n=1 Tax=Caldanaerovirga acetigignens TaxID=447595 RepID=A0A1M7IF70_9FIRM|nr:sporulation membrane protein YtaF [Caldanaerovirga acetigignens]SHM39233.1 putative sporulation protein YtaF [Caldanaerovirga acetigignens]
MADFFSCLFLSIAVSVDSFFAGLTYGLRGIRIPILSQFIIAFSTSAAFFLSMTMGCIIERVVPFDLSRYAGSAILILLGFLSLKETFKREGFKERKKKTSTIFSIVVDIMREPESADFDVSGIIESKESFFLGAALALDAVGAGLGAGAMGFKVIHAVLLVAVFEFALMSVGLYLGGKNIRKKVLTLSCLPGIILILIGIFRLI